MEKLAGLFGPDDSPAADFADFANFDELEDLVFDEDLNENQLPEILPREQFHGNIEYKRQLVKPSKHR